MHQFFVKNNALKSGFKVTQEHILTSEFFTLLNVTEFVLTTALIYVFFWEYFALIQGLRKTK